MDLSWMAWTWQTAVFFAFIALALAGVVSFSFRPILIKLAYAYVTDPVTLLALRMVVLGGVMLVTIRPRV